MTSVADARSALYKIKQARQPVTQAIEQLQEHIEHLTKQLEDTRVVDAALAEAENRAQVELDAALERHEDEAAERLRVQIEREQLRKPSVNIVAEPGSTADAAARVVRKIADNPQA